VDATDLVGVKQPKEVEEKEAFQQIEPQKL